MGVIRQQISDTARGFSDVVRNRGLRRVNLALVGSVVGDWAYGIAVAVWAYREGGAAALGIFGVVRLVAIALCSPLAAALADRYPKKLVMIASDLIRVPLVVIATIVLATDGPSMVVYALALVVSAVGTAFRPAQAALIPALADDARQLAGANVVASTIESIGFFLGPALAGVLLALADVEIVFVLNAATFLWSAIILLGVPSPASEVDIDAEARPDDGSSNLDPDAGATGRSFATEVLAGFATIGRSRELRLVIGIYAAQTVVAGASMIYEVALVLDLLERGEATLGLINAVLGIGGLAGGVVAMALSRRQRIATDFGAGVVLWAAPLLLIAARPSLVTTLVAMVVIGIANSIVDVSAYTIVQRLTPSAVMARVFGALESLLIAGMVVGTLTMTLLVSTIGVRSGIAIVGAAVTACALMALQPLRRLDRSALAPPGLDVLRKVPMLAVLPDPILERLARALVPMDVLAGDRVFAAGDPGDRYWVIERGRVSVEIDGAVIRELGVGEGFGEIALLREVPRTATVTAVEDTSLVGLDRDDFVPAVTGHGTSFELAENVVNRWLTLS